MSRNVQFYPVFVATCCISHQMGHFGSEIFADTTSHMVNQLSKSLNFITLKKTSEADNKLGHMRAV